jgi:hypothetical protein
MPGAQHTSDILLRQDPGVAIVNAVTASITITAIEAFIPGLAVGGTQLAVIGTEHSLTTQTGKAIYRFFVDTANMVDGDELELRVYYTMLVGGTERLMHPVMLIKNAQSSNIKRSLPIQSDISCRFTLKQTTGTGRNFAWKVML